MSKEGISKSKRKVKDLSTLTEPLYCLLKKGVPWRWGNQEQQAFDHLKSILCTDTVLAHFNPREKIGISCDASDVGIGAVLFHRYSDGTEHPITNASETLSATQRRYSQVQKEALAVIYGIQKFHYGRNPFLHSCYQLQTLTSLVSPTERNTHPGSYSTYQLQLKRETRLERVRHTL